MRELEWNGELLTTLWTSEAADDSMPAVELQDDTFNIHRDIN